MKIINIWLSYGSKVSENTNYFETQLFRNPTKKVTHLVNLLGHLLSQNFVSNFFDPGSLWMKLNPFHCEWCLILGNLTCILFSCKLLTIIILSGNGKTASVQHLAARTGNQLVVINMSQQSDTSDLIGGFVNGKIDDLDFIFKEIRFFWFYSEIWVFYIPTQVYFSYSK